MRIGMICPYSLAVWGGVQAQVLGLSRALRDQGVDTQVIAPCDGPPPQPWVTPVGDSIPYAQNGSLAPLAPDPAAQLRVLGAIWEEQFDLLHLHEPLAPGATLTSVLVKPAPLLGTFHASGRVTPYRWASPVVRRMARRLDLRVAVSPAAAEMGKRYLGGQYELLFNGIEVQRFSTVEPEPTNGPTVLFLGRHEPRKGLAVLVEAAELLPAEFRFWVGGAGPDTDELRVKVRDDERFEWLGPLEEHEKWARLRGADVLCVPSLWGESFGIVLLEGMAAETPVVASDLPAYRAVTDGERCASLFNVGDPDELAKTLLAAAERGQAVDDKVYAGFDRANEYSMASLARAYTDRYERLLESR